MYIFFEKKIIVSVPMMGKMYVAISRFFFNGYNMEEGGKRGFGRGACPYGLHIRSIHKYIGITDRG